MMRVLIASFARHRSRSPVRLLLSFVVLAFSMMPAMLSRELAMLDPTGAKLFALIMAAGAIGQDVSSGVITLTLARPVVRWRYVIARWLGAWLLAGTLSALLVLATTLAVTARGGGVDPAVVLRLVAELILAAGGMTALVIGFSSLVNGVADVGMIVAATILSGVLGLIGTLAKWPWLTTVGREIENTLDPTLPLAPWLAGDWSQWPQLATFLSIVTVSLAVAAWSVSRREYSYAAD